jgi:ELWxxDGT repeat protein
MRTVISALLAFAVSGFAVPVAAETPFLVKDINSLPESDGSYPDFQGVVDDVAFFSAAHSDIDREIWRTDGTENGTWQIADICPGTCSSHPAPLLATPGGFFFIASDENFNRQLWITRGEPADALQLTTGNLRIERIPRPVWDDRR